MRPWERSNPMSNVVWISSARSLPPRVRTGARPMAETEFEHDLRTMFDEAPPAPDAAAFAVGIDRRIARRMWLRAALVSVLGLIGLLIACLQLGLSPSDLNLPL